MAKEPVDVTEAGRLFHKRGPANAVWPDQFPAAVFDRGTDRPPELVDHNRMLVATDDGGRM